MRAALLFLVACTALADTVVEDFSTLEHYDSSSTAVWNIAQGRGHLPIMVTSEDLSTDEEMDVGNGSDGPFDPTTYAQFDVNGGANPNQITLDTSREYQFTTFSLDSGVTLRGTADGHLRIRVLGDATINGIIDLAGRPGGDLSADVNQSPSGGASCCGGGAGGNGGSALVAAANGVSGDTGDTGKGAGAAAGTGRGGGGAGHGGGGTPGGPGGTGGAAGAVYGDMLLSPLFGGSGGGGGADGANSSGGGGGGGGGALQLIIGGGGTLGAAGEINADGGAGGGTTNGALLGGTGGAGSGGAILVVTKGTFASSGNFFARAAAGGTGSGGGAGGGSGLGRIRIICNQPAPFGCVVGTEDPLPLDIGQSFFFDGGARTLVSKPYDTRNTAPTYDNVELAGTVTGTTVEIAGSTDNFESDDTGYLPLANLSALAGKRYFRWRLTLSTADKTTGPDIQSVTVTFTPRVQGEFKFGLAGCARATGGATPASPWGALAFLAFVLSLPLWGRRALRGRGSPTH